MDWVNLVYLGGGLLFGIAGSWIWHRQSAHLPMRSPRNNDESQPAPSAMINPLEEVQRLQAQLKQTQLDYQMAADSNQFKSGFLARTSHEIRSPLNGLIGAHQLILSDLCDDPAEEREFLGKAHQSAIKLVKMLDEILDVARTEYGKNPLDLQPLQLAKIFEEVYGLTHLQAENSNLRLQILPPEPQVYVRADRRCLRQVLVNLVDTAIQEMKEGNIALSAQPSPATGYVYIWIDDSRPELTLSDPVNLLSPSTSERDVQENPQLSPGLTLMMNQSLLELMQGRLEMVEVPASTPNSPLNRIQCSLPLIPAPVGD